MAPPLTVEGTTLNLPEVALLDGTTFKPEQAKGHIPLIYGASESDSA